MFISAQVVVIKIQVAIIKTQVFINTVTLIDIVAWHGILNLIIMNL